MGSWWRVSKVSGRSGGGGRSTYVITSGVKLTSSFNGVDALLNKGVPLRSDTTY